MTVECAKFQTRKIRDGGATPYIVQFISAVLYIDLGCDHDVIMKRNGSHTGAGSGTNWFLIHGRSKYYLSTCI